MNGSFKVGVVLAGYAAALLVVCAAFYVRGLLTQNNTAEASGGMQAFGDFILFGGLFGVLALVPTLILTGLLQELPQHKRAVESIRTHHALDPCRCKERQARAPGRRNVPRVGQVLSDDLARQFAANEENRMSRNSPPLPRGVFAS